MPDHPQIRIGTSGWHYEHWRGSFYPRDLAKSELLSHYADSFKTVEINRTFYRLPDQKVFHAWREDTPDAFIFSVKASRYITHMKKLKDCAEPIKTLFNGIEELRPKLGPVLFQLPPRWRRDSGRLGVFLAALPKDGIYAFEFRDPSWFHDDVYRLLGKHGAAFCIYELAGRLSPKTVTAQLIYVRLHGPSKHAYQGSYDDQTLAGWAGAFSAWLQQGHDVWCYFDNDQAGYAAMNAARLREMLKV